MAFEHREGSGNMFRNDEKEQPNHADWKGEIMINGQLHWLNCWVKQGKKGEYMSVSVKPKQKNMGDALKQVRQNTPSRNDRQQDNGFGDDVPF